MRERRTHARRFGPLLAVLAVAGSASGLFAGDAAAAVSAKVANDTLTITGDAGDDKLALGLAPGAPGTLQLDIGNDGSADRSFDRAQFTRVVVNAGGGADLVRVAVTDTFTKEEATTFNGQGGNDRLIGSGRGDVLSGGAGDDELRGLGGGDKEFGGDGADTFLDDVIGGPNTIDGGAGDDNVKLIASDNAETITVGPTAVAGHATVDDNDGSSRDIVAVETLGLVMHGADDRIDVTAGTGLDLDVDAGSGNDVVHTRGGDDVLEGGPGADAIAAGNGDDKLVWNDGDGNDRIEGDGGSDRLDVSGSAAAEQFSVSATSGRMRVFRDVASVALDTGSLERLAIASLGGRDIVNAPATVPGLAALELELEASDDGQLDTVFLTGSAAAESFKVAPVAPLHARVSSGAGRTVHEVIRSTELQLRAGDGDDKLTSSLSRAAFFTVLTLRGEEGNDALTGGDAAEGMVGGSGNDTLRGGPGQDVLLGEAGNDSLFGGADVDVVDGGPGIDLLDGGPGADRISCGGAGDTIVPGGVDTISADCL